MKYFLFDANTQVGSALFTELKQPGDYFYGTTATAGGFRVSPFVKLLDTSNEPLVIRTALACDVSFAKISSANSPVLQALFAAANDRRIDNDHLVVLIDNSGTSADFFSCTNTRVKILRVNVGLIYGHGEDALFQVFADAWQGRPIQQVSEAPEISMIHAIDLVRGIKRSLAEASALEEAEGPNAVPKFRELNLKDSSKGQISRLTIAQAASDFMSGLDKPLPPPKEPSEEEPTQEEAAAEAPADAEPAEEQTDAVVAEDEELPEDSHCLQGAVKGISTLVAEFVRLRGLRPLRVALVGGFSPEITAAVAAHYGLPVVDGQTLGTAGQISAEINRMHSTKFRGYLVNLGGVAGGVLEELFKQEEEEEEAEEAGNGSGLRVDVVVGLAGSTHAVVPEKLRQKWDIPVFGTDEEHVIEKIVMFIGDSPNFLGRLSEHFWTRETATEELGVALEEEDTLEEFVEDSRRLARIEDIRANHQILKDMDLRSYLMDVCIPGVTRALETLRRAEAVKVIADVDKVAFVADAINLM